MEGFTATPPLAVISVADKTGIVELAGGLIETGYRLVGSAGTVRHLTGHGIAIGSVSDLTGFPEILDGRVKTLHPRIHAGILARSDAEGDRADLVRHGIGPIRVVVVNLYPFEETVAKGAAEDDCIEEIDIGGVTLLRAAAKNCKDVAVLCDPSDYRDALACLAGDERPVDPGWRMRLAAKAFAVTARYDASISKWTRECWMPEGEVAEGDVSIAPGALARTPVEASVNAHRPAALPVQLRMGGKCQVVLPYGENPHQFAAYYGEGAVGKAPWRTYTERKPSYNNLRDAKAAMGLAWGLRSISPAAAVCAIVKHQTPCGAAVAATDLLAYRRALATDDRSAFGGVVAFGQVVGRETLQLVLDIFTEVVIAPGFAECARDFLLKRNKPVVLDHTGFLPGYGPSDFDVVSFDAGLLVQTPDIDGNSPPEDWGQTADVTADSEIDCSDRLTPEETADLAVAWQVAKWAKSNAIAIVRDGRTLGIGSGRTSRIDAVEQAVARARAEDAESSVRVPEASNSPSALAGSVAASDAFFPFPDAVIALADAGVTVIAHPGGGRRDGAVRAAARARGVKVVTTGRRHFRH